VDIDISVTYRVLRKARERGDAMNAMDHERPEGVTDEHLEYLDELRESGETNMFGAGPYVMRQFGVTRPEAHKILGYWMQTFAERHGGRRTP
jgi:hypothetical protein